MLSTFKNMFDYQTYYTNIVDNLRYYSVSENLNLPSVTSILKSTKNNYTRTSKITSAMEIGDYMHKYLQNYITDSSQNEQILKNNNYLIAESLGEIIIDKLINKFSEIWGSEVSVYYKDIYAVTIDLIVIHENELTVVDYKSSYKKKNNDELLDHYLQCAAYSIAHDRLYKTNIESIKIFQITRAGDYEINCAKGVEFNNYKQKWFERLKLFNE